MARRLILWSGGFDSTGLVLEALHRGDRVVPIVAPMGGEGWQKIRRERQARERVRAAIPFGMRERLEPEQAHTDEDQLLFWPAYDAIASDLKQRLRDAGADPWFSTQIPMLIAVADAAGPRRTVEAAYVRGDAGLACPSSRATLLEAIHLPYFAVSKADILARVSGLGLADVLGLTWSCEASNDDAPVLRACGACDPCRARIVPSLLAACSETSADAALRLGLLR